jgi:glycosyltransferase involved in cell wall biosynthesis
MRIAMLSTPFVPVPPPLYGGTELIVSELVGGLSAAGHEVTLFTCGEAVVPCEARTLYDCAQWPPDPYPELDHASWAIEEILRDDRAFDVVHAHVPAAVAFARLIDVPMAYTVHHARDPRLSSLYERSRAHLVAISARQRELAPELRGSTVIHHGLTAARHPIGDGSGGYAAFLGRFSAVKGVHHAIDAAHLAGVPIRLAGRPHWNDDDYFRRQVEARLADEGVDTVGEVGGAAKIDFLRRARALLFPIEWEEPFGLVMVEAMMCGTPVLAFRRGSVPEVVEDGVTGFQCRNVREMAARLRELEAFDRRRCRARALERFGAPRMVADHLRLYESLAATRGLDGRRRASASTGA